MLYQTHTHLPTSSSSRNSTPHHALSTLSLHDALPIFNLASNLAAFTLFASRGTVLWHLALPMAAANAAGAATGAHLAIRNGDRKSTRLNSSHRCISYAVFCLKKKKKTSIGES